MTTPVQEYHDYVRTVVLPFWLDRGFDREQRIFVERFDFLGSDLFHVPRRAMVQARQIYVFSHVARVLGLANAGEYAEEAMESLLERYLDGSDASRGFAFSATARGRQVSALRDSYTHAFILFAFAAMYRLVGSRRYLDLAESTQRFLERHLIDPVHGGLFDGFPDQGLLKRQNPLMHSLEAYLALFEASKSDVWLEKAASVVKLFSRNLLSTKFRALPERFNMDWSLPEGSVFEPGHHFEWVWLLHWFDNIAGTDHSDSSDMLWYAACEYGISPDRLCFDEVRLDGHPARTSTRLWPHAEALKAANVRARTGDHHAIKVATDMCGSLRASFLGDPFPGGWIDHRDSAGKPMVDYVPASSLYHLYCASILPEGSWLSGARTIESGLGG